MREFMEESGLSSPTFESDRDNDLFSAIFLFHHFLSPEDWTWLAGFKGFDLSDEQMRALIFVREVGAIDNQHYRSLTRADTLAASKSLRKLRTANLLSDRGGGNRAYYVPGPELLKRMPANRILGVSSLDSTQKSTDSEKPLSANDAPAALRKDIRLINLGQRLSIELARKLLVGLCSWRPLSGAEMAALLGMNAAYLTQAYLSVLVKEGHLHYLYPEQPNHPAQKYVANEPKK
jgi:ATP-dependent DNA helicase RecG